MRKAFTLMELMIVIMILGLLSAFVVPNLIGQSEKAKRQLACVQMSTIASSVKMFRSDFGAYPSIEEGISALVKNPNPEKYKNYPNGGYLDSKSEILKDPWGTEYIYTTDGGNFDIIALGLDKKEGGSGDDEDIYYSKCQEK